MFHTIIESVNDRRTFDRDSRFDILVPCGNTVSFAAGTFLALSLWLLASLNAWAQQEPTTATEIEVLV